MNSDRVYGKTRSQTEKYHDLAFLGLKFDGRKQSNAVSLQVDGEHLSLFGRNLFTTSLNMNERVEEFTSHCNYHYRFKHATIVDWFKIPRAYHLVVERDVSKTSQIIFRASNCLRTFALLFFLSFYLCFDATL